MLLLLALLLQGQLIFGQVQVVQNCVWTTTPQASLANTKLAFYKELKAIPATAPIFSQFRIILVDVGPTVTPLVQNLSFQQVIFSNVTVVGDQVFGYAVGEQNCITWENDAIKAFVALNNSAVDAVLTKYNIRLISAGVQVFPR